MITELTEKKQQELDKVEQANDESIVTCENCHAQVNGMYCSSCGQSVESTLKYFWTVILHLLDDIFSFDSRANRTLFPLLFRPGFLTKEYIAGRRVHYVPPLRLYLFISIVFFISLKYFINTDDKEKDTPKEQQVSIESQVDNKLIELDKLIAQAPEPEISQLNEEKARYEQYKTDLAQQENKSVSVLAGQLAKLDLKSNLDGTPWKQEQYNVLKEQLDKARDNEDEDKDKNNQVFSISNSEDGSFSMPFLTEGENKKLDLTVKNIQEKANNAYKDDPKKLFEAVISKMPQIMFVLLPIFAALLKIMYLFSKRLYLEHLTVALHSHSFIFFTILIIEGIGFFADYSNTKNIAWLSDLLTNLQIGLLIWIPVYLYVMQKRVYRQGYFFTTLKYSIIGTLYTIMISLAGVVALLWGAVSL